MQFQADILDVPVIRPVITETTALGAAYAAGLAVGFWKDLYALRENWKEDYTWTPAMNEQVREEQYHLWRKAVSRTFNWLDD
jgi:glycerol kinase